MTRTALDLPENPRELFTDIRVVSIPMTTRFRGITVREAMLVRGPAGWAEFSPFVEYAVPEAARWLTSTVHQARTPYRNDGARVPINATIPALPAAQVGTVAERFGEVGTVKVKIAEHGLADLEADCARLREVVRLLPHAHVRADANAAYTLAEARTACARLADFGLQYLEQPVADTEDLARLRKWIAASGLSLPLAADESIRKAEDPYRVAELDAADVMIVKVAPLGGIESARRIAAEVGLPAVVSSALDTSVGISAGCELAASLVDHAPTRDFFGGMPGCGLGTVALFESDVAVSPLRAHGGVLTAGRPEPDEDRLSALAAEPSRVRWWEARLDACWEHLRAGDNRSR